MGTREIEQSSLWVTTSELAVVKNLFSPSSSINVSPRVRLSSPGARTARPVDQS